MISEKKNIDNNKLENTDEPGAFKFKYNFINTPWDDRSNKNKIGIVALLVAMFVAIMAGVVNSFIMHYKGYNDLKNNISNSDFNCIKVKMEDYPFVARIHTVSTDELICLGAVISTTSILTNGACIESGPIRVLLGNPHQPSCRKGFKVEVVEKLHHDGVKSKKLALLSNHDAISKCSKPIRIGTKLDTLSKIYILGRLLNLGTNLSRQRLILHRTLNRVIKTESLTGVLSNTKHENVNKIICVEVIARCSIRAGDLLIQNGKLYGLSAASVHDTGEKNFACFADLNLVLNELKALDAYIES